MDNCFNLAGSRQHGLVQKQKSNRLEVQFCFIVLFLSLADQMYHRSYSVFRLQSVASFVLERGRTFLGFWGYKEVLTSRDLKMGRFAVKKM